MIKPQAAFSSSSPHSHSSTTPPGHSSSSVDKPPPSPPHSDVPSTLSPYAPSPPFSPSQPFVPDSPLRSYFPSREWAIAIPVLLMVVGLSVIGAFLGRVMLTASKKKKKAA